jgi:hypothetical protein
MELILVPLMAPRILRWLLEFWKIHTLLVKNAAVFQDNVTAATLLCVMLLIFFCGLLYNCKGFGRMWLCTNTTFVWTNCWWSAKIQTGHFMQTSPQSLTTTPIFLISLYCMQMVHRVQWISQSFAFYPQKCVQYCNCPISVCCRNPSTTDFRILWNIQIMCWMF